MKQPITLTAIILAGWLISGLGISCGLPLVPDEASLEDNAITKSMTLVLECRFKAFGPRLPVPGLGPEPDATPLLIPVPESPTSKAFLILPSVADRNHTRVYDNDTIQIEAGDSSVLIFGLALDGSQSVHNIEMAAQYQGVDIYKINLDQLSTMGKRLDIGMFRGSDTQPSHLTLTSRQGNYNSGNLRATIYSLEYPAKNLNDTTVYTPGLSTNSSQIYPAEPAYFNLPSWSYFPATTTSTAYQDPATIPAAISLGAVDASLSNYRIVLAIPQGDRFKVLARHQTLDTQWMIGDFIPWSGGGLPQVVSISASQFHPPTDKFVGMENYLSKAFVIFNQRLTQGPLTIAAYMPNPGGLFRYYHTPNNGNPSGLNMGPFSTDWPPVRALADGTLLALRDGKWTRVVYGYDGQITATADGRFMRTGTLQFLFEQSENGEQWMYFSQALPVLGDIGRANDLVMRTWKIRESEFLANNK